MLHGGVLSLLTDRCIFPSLRPQTQQQARTLSTSIFATTTVASGQIRNIGIGRERLCNLPTGFNLSDLDKSGSCLCNSLADDVGTLCFSLRSDDVGLSFLLRLLDDESCSFGILLCDLLLFDGSGEFSAKGHVCDGDIFKGNVEFLRATE